ncbi:MAG: M56 family metallopeptidase [Ruminococcaceae bacterium]|nr:M56 family metallopeptidase [Oscillospiraceae bacterium]
MKELFLDFLEVSASMAIVIAVIALFSSLIDKKFSAKWKYWVWLFIAVRLLVPYSPDFDFAAKKTEISVPDKVVYYNSEYVTGEPVPSEPAVVVTPSGPASVMTSPDSLTVKETRRTVLDVFGITWAAGSGFFVIWYIGGYFYFKNKQLRNSCPASGKAKKSVLKIKNELGIKNDFDALVSENVTSPMVMGFINPKVILPAEDFEQEELYLILRHELTHYKRRDTLYKALLLLVNALHWFNPMVWIMRNIAATDLELSCDSSVIGETSMESRIKYSETILACVHKEKTACTVFSTHFYGGAKTLKKRFKNILSTEKRKSGFVTFIAVLMLAAVSGSLIACTAVYNEPTESEIRELLQKADSVCQRNDYSLFETKNNPVIFHEENAYILIENYDSVVGKIFTENAAEKIETAGTEEGLPLYLNRDGKIYKLRGTNPNFIRAESFYDTIHWIKLISIEGNRFTYDVCHSGSGVVTRRTRIVIVNEKGKFLLDEFGSGRNYIITEEVSGNRAEAENSSGDKEKVSSFLKNYPDPLRKIPNLSTASPKRFSSENAKNHEEREILEFLYTYYSSFATLEEPDFSGFLNGGGDFTVAEQVLRCSAAKNRINKTFWTDFSLETEVLSRRGKFGLGIVSFEIKCSYSATDNYGNPVSGTDYWDIELASKASSNLSYMKIFSPGKSYPGDSGYSETLNELIEIANRYPEYKWDYRKLADYMIAEYYLGIRPTN